ncbi:MAG: serine/threonine protein phosphatase [Cytophagales bacterium]|nr:serine/threonine protein phosphatase [Cytophagales bacterium]
MRRFVIGDIHGAYRAITELFQQVQFDLSEDKLIVLGDVVDGWSEVAECIDLLSRIKNKVVIRGNHDEWAWMYYTRQEFPTFTWIKHGGRATMNSLGGRNNIKKEHLQFLQDSVYYHEEDDCLFTHAGVPFTVAKYPKINLSEVATEDFCWTREMAYDAFYFKNIENWKWGTRWKEIFVGHTPVQRFSESEEVYNTPQNWGNIWLMDTEAAYKGRVSMIDLDSKEIFQSTPCRELYPEEEGRNYQSWNQIKGKK